MFLRNDAPAATTTERSKLDVAIAASLLAMGALNLIVLVDQLGPAKAYAASPCRCGSIGGLALA